MFPPRTRCLILACGNTLRSDDGVGPWLASWAESQFAEEPAIRVIARQQWTPDLAEDLAQCESVVFIDCAIDMRAGAVRIVNVAPSPSQGGLPTHHTNAAELLALCQELYTSLPRTALLLTIGAGSIEMGEAFSPAVSASLAEACDLLGSNVRRLLNEQAC
jgi:hydrogenase maturation protease